MTLIQNLVTIDLDDRKLPDAAALEPIVDGLLDSLARSATRATFFVPWSLAEARSPMFARVAAAGHELACLTTTSPSCSTPYCVDFRGELRRGKLAMEAATGVRVKGHRAAGFGVSGASEWAYDVLVDEGFEYDSSRFPPRYTDYGQAPVPSTIHALQRWGGRLLEVPASTTDILTHRVQLATTGAVRGLPLMMWRRLIDGRQARGEPIILHLRLEELRRRQRFFRSGSGEFAADRRTLKRMIGILGSFPFTSVGSALPDLLRSAPVIES